MNTKTDVALAPETVRVDLGARAYDVVVGDNLLDEAGDRIARLKPGAKCAIVTDETVAELHLRRLERSLKVNGLQSVSIVVPAGEASKSLATLERVLDELLVARVERGDLVVALGGGVMGDLAGFAAAIALRGIGLVQIPTTLLAQVDSSVGGKTGIDSRHGKNLIGAFHQPLLVLADLKTLDTLSRRDFRAGYAEIAKYGLINDSGFFVWLEAHWQEIFAGGAARARAVATSCRAKAAIVARDEREAGERALLNLGHTFGHALESATGYSDRLLHGEGVALGIVLAFKLSAHLGHTDAATAERVVAHFAAVGLPTKLAFLGDALPTTDRIVELMAQDKKVRGGKLVFVLVRGIGQAFVAADVDLKELRAVLEAARSET
ncbi:MAG TPA: 3-dehydroquinate synthase [Xanthobacteraceae bacterium]|nr:3-dehydroquinate synthase [Xanthobacteraceae bacterium]